jgi:hypothetical protein
MVSGTVIPACAPIASGITRSVTFGSELLATRPAIGSRIPHEEKGIAIIFGITGPVTGRDYAVAGLPISYTSGGQPYTLLLWGGDMACVEANAGASSPTCNAFYSKVNAAIERMAGLAWASGSKRLLTGVPSACPARCGAAVLPARPAEACPAVAATAGAPAGPRSAPGLDGRLPADAMEPWSAGAWC